MKCSDLSKRLEFMRNTTSQMADYSAPLSCVEVQVQGTMPKGKFFMPRNVNLKARQRVCLLFGKNHHTFSFSSSRFYIVHAPISICVKGSRGLNENLLKCYCWGTLVDPENATPLNLLSVMDQVLLMVSAIFAYMAGAVPERRRNFMCDSKKENSYSSSSMPYRRSEISENIPSLKTNAMWGEVNRKLLDALEATVNDTSLDSRDAYFECDSKIYALSIFALSQSPTWRLLLATFCRLQKEVGDIQSSNEVANRGTWLVVVSEVFKGIIAPICTKWLEEELSLDTGDCNMNLVVQLSDKLKGNDVILSNIKRSGKTDLYADLLFLLRFGSLRTGCCYDTKFLVKHGGEILEDLVITLADAVACIYLELISIDSDMSNEINALSLQICPLSTRSLQRLRNEVVLKQWLQQNFESVVSLYEDRFELLALFRQKLEDPLGNRTQSSIWQKLIFNMQAAPSTLNCVQIKPISLAVKRTKELQALTGWRYYFSLFLEFSDVAMPLVKAVFNKARNAVSFFLMCMIGRSLGLIFSGIRQSLGWK